jgi:hypothetical protein
MCLVVCTQILEVALGVLEHPGIVKDGERLSYWPGRQHHPIIGCSEK